MAKKISILLGAIAAVTVLGLGIYHSDASQKGREMSEKEISELIESQYPGEITKLDLNEDAYKATIKSDVAEYELQLDAESGEILKINETRTLAAKNDQQDKKKTNEDKKTKDQDEKAANTKEKQQDKSPSEKKETPKTSIEKKDGSEKKANTKSEKKPEKKEKKTVISRDEAIKIALAQFSGEVDGVDLEEEDGRLIYEIEVERDDEEAEIEIDAYTGEVIVMEIDD